MINILCANNNNYHDCQKMNNFKADYKANLENLRLEVHKSNKYDF